MNKKVLNILFIVFIILIFTALGLINYFVDSKHIFSKKCFLNLFGENKSYYNLYMYQYKDIKSENLIVGSSETDTLFNDAQLHTLVYPNSITLAFSTYDEYYEILKYYLKLHPETKKVYFFISYSSFFFEGINGVYDINNNNILKQKVEMLFSLDTVKDLLRNYINGLKARYSNNQENQNFQGFPYFPYELDNYDVYKDKNRKITVESKYYIDKIVKLFNDNNIEYEFIIPPYNVIYVVNIYKKDREYFDTFNDIKKMVVNNYGPIYDYSRINRLTEQNMLDGTNYLYFDPGHPNFMWGQKLYIDIFYNNYAAKDLYYKHTKENIDENIKDQIKDIEKYIKNNKKYLDNYFDTRLHLNGDELLQQWTIKDDIIPDDVKIDREFILSHSKNTEN